MFYVYVLRLLSGCFGIFLGKGLAFLVKTGEQPCSAGKGEDMSELQAHHYTTP